MLNGMWNIEEAAKEIGRQPANLKAYIHARKLVPDAYDGR